MLPPAALSSGVLSCVQLEAGVDPLLVRDERDELAHHALAQLARQPPDTRDAMVRVRDLDQLGVARLFTPGAVKRSMKEPRS